MSTDLIKVGEVVQINPGACTARVVFDDEDSLVSYDLPILQRNTIDNHDYWMPDIGEDVLVLFRGEGQEEGFVIGSFYAGDVTPPESTENRRTVVFSDGTKISYDRSLHTLSATIEGTKITADRNDVKVETPNQVDVTAAKVVNVSGGTAVNITTPVLTLTMGSTKMVLKGGNATIETQNLTFKGNMDVTGTLNTSGNITTSGNVAASGSVHGSNI